MKAGLDNWIDIVVLAIYFVLVLVVGLLSVCRKGRNSVKGYFLAGRSMLWFPIGASLFASNIGSEHFIGLAGSGAASGIAVVAFEWGAALCLPLLGWVFLPIYLSSGVFTIPEYLSKRFGGSRLRTYLSILALFLYIVTKISVDVYAGSIFIQQALGWNTYLAIIILLAVTAVYTVIGGLAAVIFTDTLQTIIMLTGAVTLSILGFVQVGGINGLIPKYMDAIPDSLRYPVNITTNDTLSNVTSHCGYPRADSFHIIRDAVHSDLPWPGLLIRSTFVSTWYWCADQVIVQRALAAKDIGHARGATLMAGYLKFLPLFIIIMPGMISRVLFTEAVACADAETCLKVCDNPVGCSNVAYPKLILGLAPTGLRGLMMAVMMSALMSSLTSIFNSAATLFTMDLWTKMRKHATDRELLVVGKVFIVVLVGISVAWIPLIQNSQEGQLFLYIQAVTGYLAPPICSVFLLAVFVPRINEQGAFWGMLVGQIVGIIRMILDFVYPKPTCGTPDTRPSVVAKVNFMYFSAGLLVFTGTLVVVFSLLTKKQENKGNRLTIWSSPSIKSRHRRYKEQVEMRWSGKHISQASIQQQLEARTSVRERWSLTESKTNSNYGFEMQEVHGPDPITDENIKNDDEVMEEDKNVENEDENQYTETKKDDVDHESERGSVPVGYEINDNDTESSSVEITDYKNKDQVKVTFTTNGKEGDEDNLEGDDNENNDDNIKVRKPLTKSNSKVWRREVEKQPGWQNFVREFTKKLSEVDEDSKEVVDKRGKDILKPVSERKSHLTGSENTNASSGLHQNKENEQPSAEGKHQDDENKMAKMKNRNLEHENKLDAKVESNAEIKTRNQTDKERITPEQINGPPRISGSRYSGHVSLDIFKTRILADSIEYSATIDSAREKLYMGELTKWFLDINAVILMCLFVFLYFIFR